jgi:hypothetical protein
VVLAFLYVCGCLKHYNNYDLCDPIITAQNVCSCASCKTYTHTHRISSLTCIQVKSRNRKGENCISRNVAVLITKCRHKRKRRAQENTEWNTNN